MDNKERAIYRDLEAVADINPTVALQQTVNADYRYAHFVKKADMPHKMSERCCRQGFRYFRLLRFIFRNDNMKVQVSALLLYESV